MSFTVIDVAQRTPEWFAARCGRVTGTCAAAILATGRKKGEESVQRRDLRVRKALERLTGIPIEDDGGKPAWMQWGVDKEADACGAYEAVTGQVVRRTGFLSHNELLIGSSLDGDIRDFAGLVSFKCPKSATHWAYLEQPSRLAEDHLPQTVHELLVTDAQWSDFVSFDPRYPEHLQLVIHRVTRAQLDAELKSYKLAVTLFLGEVQQQFEAMQALLARKVAA